jgi:DNA polymerase elongation subunit (family B)
MLIEALESDGIHVVSGNTDGIVIKCPREKEGILQGLVADWETALGFKMERTDYAAIYSRDVNNYVAIKPDGKVKTKGCFKCGELSNIERLGKNPQNEICTLAVIEYLKNGKSFEQTVRECDDIRKFITLRQVNGGAMQNNNYIGKSIRWYYAKNHRHNIHYQNNGNTVPRTFGAKPIMDISIPFPTDIDYDWYVKECKEMLNGLGIKSIGQMDLF